MTGMTQPFISTLKIIRLVSERESSSETLSIESLLICKLVLSFWPCLGKETSLLDILPVGGYLIWQLPHLESKSGSKKPSLSSLTNSVFWRSHIFAISFWVITILLLSSREYFVSACIKPVTSAPLIPSESYSYTLNIYIVASQFFSTESFNNLISLLKCWQLQ